MRKKNPALPVVRQVSGGVIVYIIRNGKAEILLLEQNNSRYGRTGRNARKKVIDIGPSGRVENGESILQTAKRELFQETGLRLNLDKGYFDKYSYVFVGKALKGRFKGKKSSIRRTRKYFIAMATPQQLEHLKLSDEHVSYRFSTIEEALDSKDIMRPQKELLKRLKKRIHQLQQH
ncbi:MAG: NUDIX domain-containing protein [Candidatus Micrarchaeota archaeon]|nr:NUDIX domain-containing protein [Candidatus Micrarchaeota archaeon]